jgi:hypothetical protein
MYTSQKSALTSDDIAGIQAIYGAPAPDSNNNSFSTATNLNQKINSSSLTAMVTGVNLTTTSDLDYYTFTAPCGSSSKLTVNVQSTGLSLLAPTLTLYAANQTTVLGSATGSGTLGCSLSVTIAGITAGQVFYVKVGSAVSTAFGTGAYALTLNFGTGPSPTVPRPNTQTLASGTPTTSGGYGDGAHGFNLAALTGSLSPLLTASTTILAEVPGRLWIDDDVHSDQFAGIPAVGIVHSLSPKAVAADIPVHTPIELSFGLPAFIASPISLWTHAPQSLVSSNYLARTWIADGPHSLPASSSTTVTTAFPLDFPLSGVGSKNIPSGDFSIPIGVELAPTDKYGPDENGSSPEEQSREGITPAVGAALPTPAASLHDPWTVPSLLFRGAEEESEISQLRENPDDHSWQLVAAMAGFIGLNRRAIRGHQQRRRQQTEAKELVAERRRMPRFPCWLDSSCWPLGRPAIERCQSIVQNVSSGGVNLVLRRPFDEGTILVMEVKGAGTAKRRCVVGRVLHVVELEQGVWQLGCVFEQSVDDECVHELLLGGLQTGALAIGNENGEGP